MIKLYTEEQLRKALFTYPHPESTSEELLKELTPIELPSDEEIETKAESFYPISKEYKEKYKTDYDDFNTCWQEGAKWMKEMILNKSK